MYRFDPEQSLLVIVVSLAVLAGVLYRSFFCF
jgi:hypothetical protein